MPDAGPGITSAPDQSFQPYDAAADNNIGKWKSVDSGSGPANSSGKATGPFESTGKWKQT